MLWVFTSQIPCYFNEWVILMNYSMYIDAIHAIFTSYIFFYIVVGTLLGVIFGAIPGLTATLAVVILIPFTYGLDPVTGMSMLMGAYIGGVSGGLVSAILIGIPGTSSSVTTVFDGYPMAQKGLGGKALGTGIVANVIGSLIGIACLVIFAPQLAKIALSFGSYEYTMLVLFAFLTVVGVSGGKLSKGVLMVVFGLCIGTLGLDHVNGELRATFGLEFLKGGVSAIPAMIGLLVLSTVFKELEKDISSSIIPKVKVNMRNVHPSWKELKESSFNFVRSGGIGVFIGLLPGIGGTLANFVAYDRAKKASKDPESFGKGNLQGIVASETANNAVIGAALIPLLAFGIPGDAVSAMLLGGLQIQGIQPGPLIFRDQPDLVVGIFVSLFLAVMVMYLLMICGIKFFQKLLSVKKIYLLPLVLVMGIAGSYNISYRISDIWVVVLFGIIGYLLLKFDYPIIPLVISLLLGPILESNLRISLMYSNGSLIPFFTRPFSLSIFVMILLTIFFIIRKRKAVGEVNDL